MTLEPIDKIDEVNGVCNLQAIYNIAQKQYIISETSTMLNRLDEPLVEQKLPLHEDNERAILYKIPFSKGKEYDSTQLP